MEVMSRPEVSNKIATLDAGYANWLSGLIDGEGCFTIQHGPRFALGVRYDDWAVLVSIYEALGIGSITINSSVTTNGSRAAVVWIVSNAWDCGALIEVLDKYPLKSKKHSDYLVWKEAVKPFLLRARFGIPLPKDHWKRAEGEIKAARKSSLQEDITTEAWATMRRQLTFIRKEGGGTIREFFEEMIVNGGWRAVAQK